MAYDLGSKATILEMLGLENKAFESTDGTIKTYNFMLCKQTFGPLKARNLLRVAR